MANEEKFWLDRDLWEIPLLTCEKDVDFKAIMSRFHYLLLKKDASTYEEFLKYWAILVVSAPVSDSGLLNTKAHGDAIEFNRPLERMSLLPEELRRVDADSFRRENWARIMEDDYPEPMDDAMVHEWYTTTDDGEARRYFGRYCIRLLTAYTLQPSAVAEQCQKDVHGITIPKVGPGKVISFGLSMANFVRDAFRSQVGTYRKVLRAILDWYHHKPIDESCPMRILFRRDVEPSLAHFDLKIMISMLDKFRGSEKIQRLALMVEQSGSEELRSSLRSFNAIADYIDGVRLQDRSFLAEQPHCKDETCQFWPYSRLFSSLYFNLLANRNHFEFFGFCAGWNGDRLPRLDSLCCLDSLNDFMSIADAEARIERGWRYGGEHSRQEPKSYSWMKVRRAGVPAGGE